MNDLKITTSGKQDLTLRVYPYVSSEGRPIIAEESEVTEEDWKQQVEDQQLAIIGDLIQYGEIISGVYVSTSKITDLMGDADQAWFWTPEWQEAIQEAEQDLKEGRYRAFDNMDDFNAALDDDE